MSTSSLIGHVNSYKILITLPSRLPSTPAPIFEYNITNHPNLPSDNFKEDMSLRVPNNNKEEIRLADTISSFNRYSKPANIDKERPTTPNWISQNVLLSELSRNFREVTFSESEFPVGTLVLDTRYVHPER